MVVDLLVGFQGKIVHCNWHTYATHPCWTQRQRQLRLQHTLKYCNTNLSELVKAATTWPLHHRRPTNCGARTRLCTWRWELGVALLRKKTPVFTVIRSKMQCDAAWSSVMQGLSQCCYHSRVLFGKSPRTVDTLSHNLEACLTENSLHFGLLL